MKDSLIVLGFFVGGCLLGALGKHPEKLNTGKKKNKKISCFYINYMITG